MAGMFDSFVNQNDPELIRKQLMEQQQADFVKFSQGGSSQKDTAARNVMAGFLGLSKAGVFGDKLKGMMTSGIEKDPALMQAQQNASLMEQMQAIEGDPASAEFATKAAKLALDAGRADLAFQLSQTAGQRAAGERKMAAAAAQQEGENWRASFNTQPKETKLAMIANDPEVLTKRLNLSPEQAKLVAAEAQQTLETIRLKNTAELNKVKPYQGPNKVTDQDRENTKANLSASGYKPQWMGNYRSFGDAEMDQLTSLIAGQSSAEMAKANRENVDVSIPTLEKSIMDDLVEQGAITVNDDGEIQTLDATAINNVFTNRLGGTAKLDQKDFAGAPPVGTVQDGYKYKGGDPANPENWTQVK